MHRAQWLSWCAAFATLTGSLLLTALVTLPAAVQQRHSAAKPAPPAPKKPAPTGAPLCQAKNVTVELPRDFLQLVVLNNSFIAKENSAGVLQFQNFFPQPIQEIAIVAEYQDANGKLIYPSVFAATATETTTPTWFATYLPTQYEITQWKQPIAPRATFTLGATSGITTSACPAQINVTLMHLEFSNGQQMNYSAPGCGPRHRQARIALQPNSRPDAGVALLVRDAQWDERGWRRNLSDSPAFSKGKAWPAGILGCA